MPARHHRPAKSFSNSVQFLLKNKASMGRKPSFRGYYQPTHKTGLPKTMLYFAKQQNPELQF